MHYFPLALVNVETISDLQLKSVPNTCHYSWELKPLTAIRKHGIKIKAIKILISTHHINPLI
jgi:hypothetical protein